MGLVNSAAYKFTGKIDKVTIDVKEMGKVDKSGGGQGP